MNSGREYIDRYGSTVVTGLIILAVVGLVATQFPAISEELEGRRDHVETYADGVYGEGQWEWNREDCRLSCEVEPEPLPGAKTQADFDEVAPDDLAGREGSGWGQMAGSTVTVLLIFALIVRAPRYMPMRV